MSEQHLHSVQNDDSKDATRFQQRLGTMTPEQAFYFGRLAGITAQCAANHIDEAKRLAGSRFELALNDLYSSGAEKGEHRYTAPLAAAWAVYEQLEARHGRLPYSNERAELLRVARLCDDPDDVLSKARRALMWVQMAQEVVAEHDAGEWCDDARRGGAEVLDAIRFMLEVADVEFHGRYNTQEGER